MRARACIRNNFGLSPATRILSVCAAMLVQRDLQFRSVLTVVGEITLDITEIEAVGFGPNLMQTMERWKKCRFLSIVASSVTASSRC
jgi:hypothetical protein